MISAKELLTEGKWQAVMLAVGLVLYLVSPASIKPLVGLSVGAYLVISFFYESFENVKSKGWKEEAKNLGTTLLAIILLFSALRFILNTETPISAVVSCSMVPEINRGDLIIVKGESTYRAGGEVEGNAIELFDPITEVYFEGKNIGSVPGSLYSYCLGGKSSKEVCKQFYESPSSFYEKRGEFKFFYGECIRGGGKEPCTTEIGYRGERYGVKEGDVIVYIPEPGTLFSNFGDIIHRAVLKVRTGEKTYYITKGDNNNVLDIQFFSNGYNTPPEESSIRGKVLFKVPLLGYYKIFITPYLQEDESCRNPLTYQ